jgi:hypothetical protein
MRIVISESNIYICNTALQLLLFKVADCLERGGLRERFAL